MRRLGRLPHSPEAVAAAPSLRYAAEAPPPPTLDRTGIAYQPILANNDSLPTCTVAALLNAALAIEALQGAGGLAIKDGCWLPFYAALAGCAPTPEVIAGTDGLVLLDVLRRQGTRGFDIGAVAPLTGDFGTVPLEINSLASCAAGLGGVYVGLDLYQSDMDAVDVGRPWAANGMGAVGPLVGGHCVWLWSYEGLQPDSMIQIATWGALQQASWAWLLPRLQEAYGLLLPGIEGPDVDLAALKVANARWLAT
jgi:hypothetical protein